MKYLPTISVVIDAYNYGQFIDEAIESVLHQDFPREEVEVLVVDDGSTDDTRERVAKYADHVQYFRKPNGGQASAFNFGVERASGKLVAFLDADDYWLPNKLRRVVEEFDARPGAGLVYHPFREFRTQTGEWSDGGFNSVSGDVTSDRKNILQYTATQTSGLTFRTDLLRRLLPLNTGMTIQADGLLAALIIFLAPVVAIPEPLAVYRIHGSNLYVDSGKTLDRKKQMVKLQTHQVILEEMDCWLKQHGFALNQPEILAFRRRWRHVYEREEFRLVPPGRLRFCWHLLRMMANLNPCLTRKVQVVNCLNALGSLFFGYEHYERFDQWRVRAKHLLRGARWAQESAQSGNRA